MTKNSIIGIVAIFILFSCCNSNQSSSVRTYHPASPGENDYFDKVYDPDKNTITYIAKYDRNMDDEIAVLNLNTCKFTKKKISYVIDTMKVSK